MKPTLYMYPGACSRVTMTALEEAGADYDFQAIDLQSGAQKSEKYLSINRKGKVPALAVDGKLLTENAAILRYLHRRYPGAALLPQANDLADDTRGLIDIVWCSSTLHPMVRQMRNPQRWTKGETSGVKADGLEKFAVECAYMSTRLSGDRWWYGERWSIVDTYLYWAYSTAAKGDFPLTDFPILLEHAQRVRARPAFQRALNKEIAAVAASTLSLEPSSL